MNLCIGIRLRCVNSFTLLQLLCLHNCSLRRMLLVYQAPIWANHQGRMDTEISEAVVQKVTAVTKRLSATRRWRAEMSVAMILFRLDTPRRQGLSERGQPVLTGELSDLAEDFLDFQFRPFNVCLQSPRVCNDFQQTSYYSVALSPRANYTD
jgi:hypothetical protein